MSPDASDDDEGSDEEDDGSEEESAIQDEEILVIQDMEGADALMANLEMMTATEGNERGHQDKGYMGEENGEDDEDEESDSENEEDEEDEEEHEEADHGKRRDASQPKTRSIPPLVLPGRLTKHKKGRRRSLGPGENDSGREGSVGSPHPDTPRPLEEVAKMLKGVYASQY
jgi:hypothetical protein